MSAAEGPAAPSPPTPSRACARRRGEGRPEIRTAPGASCTKKKKTRLPMCVPARPRGERGADGGGGPYWRLRPTPTSGSPLPPLPPPGRPQQSLGRGGGRPRPSPSHTPCHHPRSPHVPLPPKTACPCQRMRERQPSKNGAPSPVTTTDAALCGHEQCSVLGVALKKFSRGLSDARQSRRLPPLRHRATAGATRDGRCAWPLG